MTDYKNIVYESAAAGEVQALGTALTQYPALIDAPHPKREIGQGDAVEALLGLSSTARGGGSAKRRRCAPACSAAARRGQGDAVEALLCLGSSDPFKNTDGMASLYVAASQRRADEPPTPVTDDATASPRRQAKHSISPSPPPSLISQSSSSLSSSSSGPAIAGSSSSSLSAPSAFSSSSLGLAASASLPLSAAAAAASLDYAVKRPMRALAAQSSPMPRPHMGFATLPVQVTKQYGDSARGGLSAPVVSISPKLSSLPVSVPKTMAMGSTPRSDPASLPSSSSQPSNRITVKDIRRMNALSYLLDPKFLARSEEFHGPQPPPDFTEAHAALVARIRDDPVDNLLAVESSFAEFYESGLLVVVVPGLFDQLVHYKANWSPGKGIKKTHTVFRFWTDFNTEIPGFPLKFENHTRKRSDLIERKIHLPVKIAKHPVFTRLFYSDKGSLLRHLAELFRHLTNQLVPDDAILFGPARHPLSIPPGALETIVDDWLARLGSTSLSLPLPSN